MLAITIVALAIVAFTEPGKVGSAVLLIAVFVAYMVIVGGVEAVKKHPLFAVFAAMWWIGRR